MQHKLAVQTQPAALMDSVCNLVQLNILSSPPTGIEAAAI